MFHCNIFDKHRHSTNFIENEKEHIPFYWYSIVGKHFTLRNFLHLLSKNVWFLPLFQQGFIAHVYINIRAI